MWRSGSAGGALEKVYPAPYRVAFKNTSVQKHYSLGGGATDVYMSSDKQDVVCLREGILLYADPYTQKHEAHPHES